MVEALPARMDRSPSRRVVVDRRITTSATYSQTDTRTTTPVNIGLLKTPKQQKHAGNDEFRRESQVNYNKKRLPVVVFRRENFLSDLVTE